VSSVVRRTLPSVASTSAHVRDGELATLATVSPLPTRSLRHATQQIRSAPAGTLASVIDPGLVPALVLGVSDAWRL
jgi:hypothetical protein